MKTRMDTGFRRYDVILGLLLALFSSPAPAQIQFDTAPTAADLLPPGIRWLQQKPMTLFDLGMMELTRTADKATEGLFDIGGAVAEMSEDGKRISISIYGRTDYSPQNCNYIITKIRDQMFPLRDDKERLALELVSYFVGYGPAPTDKPRNIGAELVDRLMFVVYMPGGTCLLPLLGDETSYLADPNYKPEPPPAAAADIPDITKPAEDAPPAAVPSPANTGNNAPPHPQTLRSTTTP